MQQTPDQNGFDLLRDAVAMPGDDRKGILRGPYSAETAAMIEAELGAVASNLDARRHDDALRSLEFLPGRALRREVPAYNLLYPEHEEGLRDVLPERRFLEMVERSLASFEDGTYGFAPDVRNIRFELTPEKLRLLKTGFRTGALNMAVLEAYPTAAQRAEIEQRNDLRRKLEYDRPTEFLVKHFKGRGGRMGPNSASDWTSMRAPQAPGTLPAVWSASRGDVARAYELLPDQPPLKDLYGTVRLVFTNAVPQLSSSTPLLGADGVLSVGEDRTFGELMELGVDLLTPSEYLSLLAAADPKDPNTYPVAHSGIDATEWIGGIGMLVNSRVVAGVRMASVGLMLDSCANRRNVVSGHSARSVLR